MTATPPREGVALIRCMGGRFCSHAPGTCTAFHVPISLTPTPAPPTAAGEPCEYCGNGKYTGLPGNACENCMNTGLKHPEQGEVTQGFAEASWFLRKSGGDEFASALEAALRTLQAEVERLKGRVMAFASQSETDHARATAAEARERELREELRQIYVDATEQHADWCNMGPVEDEARDWVFALSVSARKALSPNEASLLADKEPSK